MWMPTPTPTLKPGVVHKLFWTLSRQANRNLSGDFIWMSADPLEFHLKDNTYGKWKTRIQIPFSQIFVSSNGNKHLGPNWTNITKNMP